MIRRWLFVLTWGAGMLCGPAVLADEKTQDPLAAPTYFTMWGLTERTWVEGSKPKDLPGAYVQGEIGHGRFGFSGQAQWSGLPGEFDQGKLETVRAASGYVAVSYNVARLPLKMTLAPIAVFGAAVTVESKESLEVVLPRAFTVGGGLRIANETMSLAGYVGQHHSLHGLAGGARWSIRIGGAAAWKVGEIRNIGIVACDKATCITETAVAVSFKVWR